MRSTHVVIVDNTGIAEGGCDDRPGGMAMSFNVRSEVGRLRHVIVHRQGPVDHA
jgi:hypothetical protein